MNHDTTPTPRWEIKISDEDGITPYLWDDRKSDNYDLGTLCRILNEYEEKTNEVARLRELLNRAIETARTLRKLAFINSDDYCDWHFEDRTKAANDFADLCKEVSRLAPAPEEPVIQDSRITEPEWRELGPDEVICEGDEVQPKHHSRDGTWIKVWNHEIGATPEDQEAMRYCTRRPLPKQEEMPLEDEIEEIWEHSEHIDSLTGHMAFKALAKSIRYLRDEIVKIGNISSEDSGYNFTEIEKIWKEIQKLQAK